MEENTIIQENVENMVNTEDSEVSESESIEVSETIYEETVSSGDYLPSLLSNAYTQTLTVEDITLAIEEAVVQAEIVVTDGNSIFEKPIEDYTPTEFLLLLLVLFALGFAIEKIIGGVLNCTKLFNK